MKPLMGISLIFLTIGLPSCSDKTLFPAQSMGKTVQFGHGGGFAGIEYRYVLLSDGRLFSKSTKKEYVFMKKIPKRTAVQLSSNIDALASSILAVNDPGNTYQFLELHGDEKKARWVWNSSNRTNLDSELQINYSLLMRYTSSTERTSNQ